MTEVYRQTRAEHANDDDDSDDGDDDECDDGCAGQHRRRRQGRAPTPMHADFLRRAERLHAQTPTMDANAAYARLCNRLMAGVKGETAKAAKAFAKFDLSRCGQIDYELFRTAIGLTGLADITEDHVGRSTLVCRAMPGESLTTRADAGHVPTPGPIRARVHHHGRLPVRHRRAGRRDALLERCRQAAIPNGGTRGALGARGSLIC